MFPMVQSVRTDLEHIARGFDATGLGRETAIHLVEELGAIRSLADGMIAKAAKRVDDTRADARENDRDGAALCARLLGSRVGEARRAIETARKLERLPATDAAVRDGSLSARQAQMIADAATINPAAEGDLIATAELGLVPLKDACIAARAAVEDGAARATRQYAARNLRTWTDDDGMFAGRFRLTPEIGGRVKAVLDAETRRLFRARSKSDRREPLDAYAADALTNIVLGEIDNSKGARETVHVVIDHAALVRGNAGEGERCEIPGVGPVSVDWARQLLGSAFVTAVVAKGRDIVTVAHFGRHIPAELRTAMIVGGHECDVEDCHARGYLELDHCEVDYAEGGATAYWNLAWLCYVHHRMKSKGWTLGPPDPVTGKRRLQAPDADRPAAA